MAKRDNPMKSLKVKVINLVLYPEEAQKTENYIEYFRRIFDDKVTINTYGDRYTRIQTYYILDDGAVIHGVFANAAFFDPKDPALDSDTNEIVPSGADPKKGLGLKTWEYYFFPKYHRLIFLDKETSGSQILDFLQRAFNNYLDTEEYAINLEKDREVISRILNSTALSHLKVFVSYSNNDNYKGWKQMIDNQLKKGRPKRAVLDLSGSKKIPIDVTQSEMIQGFVELSASNGHAEASEINQNGKIVPVNTQDHPMVKIIEFLESPISAMKHLVKQLAGFEEESSD